MTPPIVLDLLRGGRRYPSWQAARHASMSYDDEGLNAFKVARGTLRPVDGAILRSNLLHLAAIALRKTDLIVTDFGGSTGDLGTDFLSDYPQATYTVVETPAMVSMMLDRCAVRFARELPPQCDIFFSSGTLQYVEEPLGVLAAGFASARSTVVLVRNSFSEEEIFRVQRSKLFANGSGPIPPGYRDAIVSYPHRTINEGAVNAIAKQHGFRCVMRLEEQSGVLSYLGKVYGAQLVFAR